MRSAIAATMLLTADAASAQSREFTACMPDVLGACSTVRFEFAGSELQIGIRAIDALGATPVSFYNFVFGTGRTTDPAGVSNSVTPTTIGAGASLSDPSPWDLFESGDALFLTSTGNAGIGGCTSAPATGGFSQAATTCGGDSFIRFSLTPSFSYALNRFTLLNLEAVSLATGEAMSCSADATACSTIDDVFTPADPGIPVPEPTSLSLLVGGGVLVAWTRTRQRRAAR